MTDSERGAPRPEYDQNGKPYVKFLSPELESKADEQEKAFQGLLVDISVLHFSYNERTSFAQPTPEELMEILKRVDARIKRILELDSNLYGSIVEPQDKLMAKQPERRYGLGLAGRGHEPRADKSPRREQEISPEEKRGFLAFWQETVLGHEKQPTGMIPENNEALGSFLYESLMREMPGLLKEFDLEPDMGKISAIQAETNTGKRSNLQREYLQGMVRRFEVVVSRFGDPEKDSRKWNDWPTTIRDEKTFNCVGAALLGMALLEQAGVRSAYGRPSGHAVNLARLDNGERWYLDLMNGRLEKIISPGKFIAETPIFQPTDPIGGYRLIPCFDNKEITSAVLGNLGHLKNAVAKDDFDNDADRRRGQEIYSRIGEIAAPIDFEKIETALYPRVQEVKESPDMQAEDLRVETLRKYLLNLRTEFPQFLGSREKPATINIAPVRDFLLGAAVYDGSPADFPTELRPLAERLKEWQQGELKETPDVYRDLVLMVTSKKNDREEIGT